MLIKEILFMVKISFQSDLLFLRKMIFKTISSFPGWVAYVIIFPVRVAILTHSLFKHVMAIVFKICQILNHLLHEPKVNSNSQPRSLVLAQWLAGGSLDLSKEWTAWPFMPTDTPPSQSPPTNPKHSKHDPKFNPLTHFASYMHDSHSNVRIKGHCITHTATSLRRPIPIRQRAAHEWRL